MKSFAAFLRIAGPGFLLVGALHLALGLGADELLGAKIPPEVKADPALDSQNRFYGVAFSLYGVLMLLCASDLPKYAAVLKCILWVFFAAGLARLVSILLYGMPPAAVTGLLLTELISPPLLLGWFSRARRTG